jgi:hypothetical protein
MSNDPDTDVTFYDNFVPSLKAGEYTVTVSQTLTAAVGSKAPGTPQEPVAQKFIVRGPRFQLDPADVHRVFPPASATGVYGEYLPMIVLNKRALPWERELELTPPAPACPWMALLVFSEQDLPAPQPAGSLRNPTRATSVPLAQVISPPAGTLGPALRLQDDEDPAAIFCNVIDVPAAAFVGLTPVLADLPLLAHVRRVSTEDKEPQNAKHEGWYSCVIANRFAVAPPESGEASRVGNIVHLVSLEGFESYLKADGAVARPAEQTVRLVSLYSWSFTCLREPAQNFSELMLNLVAQVNGARPDLLLRLPLASQPPDDPVALAGYTRLREGYTPMSYAAQTGERGFAWYRGPLAPVVAAEFMRAAAPGGGANPAAPKNSSEAMIFDASTGVFDLSYAVAFQTGRSLALSSLPFSTALLQWRREAHALVDLLSENLRSGLSAVAGGAASGGDGDLQAARVTDLAPLLDPKLAANAFKHYLATGFYEEAAKHVGRVGGSPASSAGPPPAGARRQVLPSDLLKLTRQPQVAALLQHASGLANFGTTAAPVAPGDTAVSLLEPGAADALGAGAELFLVSADGQTVSAVRTTAEAAAGDSRLAVAPFAGAGAQPAGSSVQLLETSGLARTVVNWLARAALLYGVPFNNLVPDERMLPAESIRFFYLDPNWVDALVAGALSAGTQSSRDALFNQLMRAPLGQAVNARLAQVRDARRGARGAMRGPTAAAAAAVKGTPAGLVLRSAVVSGWPGLEVRAYSGADESSLLKPLRLDRVAPDVLLAIYPDVPQRVEFNEPSEGLVFGTEDEGVDLRYVPGAGGETPANVGRLYDPKVTLARSAFPWRSPSDWPGTLRVGGTGGLADLLRRQFAAAGISPPPPFGPAAFAVQMVRVPEQMLFLPQSNGENQ